MLWALLLVLCVVAGAGAQPPILVESNQYEARFRQHIVFRLVAEGQVGIDEVTLFYRVADELAVNRVSPEFEPGTRVEVAYSWDLTSGSLPPGVQVTYWWKLSGPAGHTLETEPQSLLYTDGRYDWQSLSAEGLVLYWYRGDEDFGQALFDKGQHTLDTLRRDVGVTAARQAQVFIYGSHTDLLGAIAEGAKEWTGGQAFPDVGVVVIGVAPNNLPWGQRAMAHELTHLVVHQMVDTPLGALPQWLDEGLAMYGEGKLEPSYQYALEQAIRQDQLITVRSLSSSFPADPELAHLSYAQSYSLVEFILEAHGREAMSRLLQAFAEGAYADDALQQVLGLDSDGLDAAWREWVQTPPSQEPQQSAPAPVGLPRRSTLPSRLVAVATGGACCAGGVLVIVVVALLAFAQRR
jgi:hypothetical protein